MEGYGMLSSTIELIFFRCLWYTVSYKADYGMLSSGIALALIVSACGGGRLGWGWDYYEHRACFFTHSAWYRSDPPWTPPPGDLIWSPPGSGIFFNFRCFVFFYFSPPPLFWGFWRILNMGSEKSKQFFWKILNDFSTGKSWFLSDFTPESVFV